MKRSSILVRLLLPLLAVVLPAILLLGALRTVRNLEQEKEAYLRSRAAGVAARIETLRNPAGLPDLRAALEEEDPNVVGIDLFTYDDPASGRPRLSGKAASCSTSSECARGEKKCFAHGCPAISTSRFSSPAWNWRKGRLPR